MAYRRLLEHEDNDLCDVFLWRERELFASLIASTTRKQFARANIPRPNSRAPPPPQVAHEEASIGSLVDVDSPHVASVSSDYSGKTQTQVEREEREAEDAEREAREKFNEVSEEASQKYEKGKKEASEKGKELKREASAKGKEVEADAKVVGHDISEASKDAKHDLSEKAKVARQKAKEAGHEANEKAKIAGQKTKEAAHDANERAQEAGHELNENRDNPVVIANALIIGLGSAFVGYVSSNYLTGFTGLTFGQIRRLQEIPSRRAQLASRRVLGRSDRTVRAWRLLHEPVGDAAIPLLQCTRR